MKGKKLEEVTVNRDYVDMQDPLVPKFKDMNSDFKSRLYWGGRTQSGRVHYQTPTEGFSLPIK